MLLHAVSSSHVLMHGQTSVNELISIVFPEAFMTHAYQAADAVNG